MGRYIMNNHLECGFTGKDFTPKFFAASVYLFEGTSMGVMMLFHFMNFKKGNPILLHDDSTSVIIRREEFDTEEVISSS